MFSEPTTSKRLCKSPKYSFDELIELFTEKGFDTSMCYCKKCSKPIIYDNAQKFGAYIKNGYLNYFIKCPSFLTTHIHNGKEYRLCYCRNCVEEKFPEKKSKPTKNYFQPAAFVTQYAFQVADEDFNITKQRVCSHTYETTIAKWGKELGEKKWKDYCDKQALTNTFEYKKEHYGWTEKQFKEYNKSRAVTLENLIKRYGEEIGKKKWNDYCEKQRYTCSVEYFIKTYGREKGLEKYNSFNDKRFFNPYKDNKIGAYSQISQELFKNIHKYFPTNDIYYANLVNEFGGEYPVAAYSLDYYDKTLNVIIEFNGDLWHANPKKYAADDYIKNPFSGEYVKASEIWERDRIRLERIKREMPIEPAIIIVWESDYKSDPDKVIKSIVAQLKEIEKAKSN